MRRNKKLLFGGLGFLGGVVGSLAAQLLPESSMQSPWLRIGCMAMWGAVCAAGILVGVTWALEVYSGRNRPSMAALWKALVSGLLAGAIAAGIAQAVFTVRQFSGLAQFFFQSGCWGVAGAVLGWRLSRSIANLGAVRGVIAGLLGGWIGCMGFLLAAGFVAK